MVQMMRKPWHFATDDTSNDKARVNANATDDRSIKLRKTIARNQQQVSKRKQTHRGRRAEVGSRVLEGESAIDEILCVIRHD